MAEIQTRPYKPDPAQCCEACAFGSGEHAPYCLRDDPHEHDLARLADDGGPHA